jgi:serine/threonine protein kinase
LPPVPAKAIIAPNLMTMTPGQRLGAYEILSLLGSGGMGEVYRARDSRVDRIVAIKVLPAHLADRLDLRERLEGEPASLLRWKSTPPNEKDISMVAFKVNLSRLRNKDSWRIV